MKRARSDLARVALRAALLSLTLLAAGCAQPVERDDTPMSIRPEQVRRAPTQPAVRPQEEAVAEKKQKPAEAASKQPVQDSPPEEAALTPAAAPPATPAHTASELMGKSESEVTALMGTPVRVEQRAASTVWVYQGGDCSLDVFFFLDVATSDERVLTVAPTAESAAAAAAAEQAPSAEEQAAAADTADPAKSQEGAVVDACYGKLRRS